MSNYKRLYRELSADTKSKISNANRNKPKSATHRLHISQALTKYWQTVPHRPAPGESPSVSNWDNTTYQCKVCGKNNEYKG